LDNGCRRFPTHATLMSDDSYGEILIKQIFVRGGGA
jgi:hypothetical protein